MVLAIWSIGILSFRNDKILNSVTCQQLLVREYQIRRECIMSRMQVCHKTHSHDALLSQGATNDDFSGHFRIFEIINFCFVVAICDIVQAVEAKYGLPSVLTASGNLF